MSATRLEDLVKTLFELALSYAPAPMTAPALREVAAKLRAQAKEMETNPHPSMFDTEMHFDLLQQADDYHRQAAAIDALSTK